MALHSTQARNKHKTQGERTLTFDSLVDDDVVPSTTQAGTNRTANSIRAAAVLVEEPEQKNQENSSKAEPADFRWQRYLATTTNEGCMYPRVPEKDCARLAIQAGNSSTTY